MSDTGLAGMQALARTHGWRTLVYLANFGLARGTAFIGPLALAALLPGAVYGSIELGLSAATMIALAAGLGIASAVPQLTLLRRAVPVIDLLAVLVAAAGAVLLAAGALAWSLGHMIAALALFMAVAALAQGALSVYCRSFSLRNWASWTDSSFTLAALAIGLCAVALGRADVAAFTAGFAGLALAIALTGAALGRRFAAGDLAGRLRRAFRLGLPLLTYSAVGVWIAASGRLLLGAFLSVRDVAVYSFEFRLASVLLVIHAVVATGLFARVYSMRTRRFDRVAAVYFAMIGALALILSLAAQYALPYVKAPAIADGNLAEAMAIFPLVANQALGWNASALLEVRINRARLASRAALGAAAAAGMTAISIWLMSLVAIPSLPRLCLMISAQWAALNAVQLCVLARKGLPLPRIAVAIGVSYVGQAMLWLVVR
jgi:hypothetical protein